ncbi:MAG: hypothetical protein ABI373_02985 [Flavobacteriales bacterium]
MFDRFLDWFDRHKFGVIGTLVVHTFLIFTLFMGTLKTEGPPVEPPPLELQMDAAPEEPTPQPQEKQSQAQDMSGKVTNLASNSTAKEGSPRPMSQAAKERMAEDVDKNLHDMEKDEFQKLADQRKAEGKEITVPKLDPSKFDPKNYTDKTPKPVKVKGLTTVSYDLVGRTDVVLDVPAYLCKGQGKVVVRVAVARTGEVTKAELDVTSSTTTNDCMVSNAISSASSARFSYSSSSPQPQRGTITYIFLAQ